MKQTKNLKRKSVNQLFVFFYCGWLICQWKNEPKHRNHKNKAFNQLLNPFYGKIALQAISYVVKIFAAKMLQGKYLEPHIERKLAVSGYSSWWSCQCYFESCDPPSNRSAVFLKPFSEGNSPSNLKVSSSGNSLIKSIIGATIHWIMLSKRRIIR